MPILPTLDLSHTNDDCIRNQGSYGERLPSTISKCTQDVRNPQKCGTEKNKVKSKQQ